MLVQKSTESRDIGAWEELGGVGWLLWKGHCISCLMGKCPLFFFLIVHVAP